MTQKPQPIYSVKAESNGFTVYRDADALQTPKNLHVTVPTRTLAEAIVAECVGQGERLDLRQMPMTQMTLTALDITASHRGEVITGIVRYGENELVCLRATEPEDLVAEQNKAWQPYLDWCREKFKVELQTGHGITPVQQKPEALTELRAVVQTYDTFPLTGLSEAVGVSGSLVLGLALATKHADTAAVFQTAELDQLWQAKKWGIDPAMQGRHEEIKRDLEICAKWFDLVA
ncbi:MAG: ATP12 family protein [Alphaproteobacteria bacterium]